MRIAVISDVHSNFYALELVMSDALRRGVDDYWFLGDAVGYGYQPLETLDLLAQKVPLENWVLGNHDALYAGRLHPGDSREEAQIMINHNRLLIDERRTSSPDFANFLDKRFSLNCQIPRQKYMGGSLYFLTHAGLEWERFNYYFFDTSHQPDIEQTDKLFGGLSVERLNVRSWKFWKKLESEPRVLFLGHTHLPVLAYMDKTTGKIRSLKVREGIIDLKKDCKDSGLIAINPGSVGFPKDRWQYPSYVILDTKKRRVEFCRIKEYDCHEFENGYRYILDHVGEYIQGGLWKHSSGGGHTKYEIGKIMAQKAISKIQKEVRNAPHPANDHLTPGFREFYKSSLSMDLEGGDKNGI